MGLKTAVIQIGNSRGIRIPKAFLEQCGLRDAVELEARRGHMVVRPAVRPRSGWDDAFCRMHEHGDDVLVDQASLSATEFDTKEWEW